LRDDGDLDQLGAEKVTRLQDGIVENPQEGEYLQQREDDEEEVED